MTQARGTIVLKPLHPVSVRWLWGGGCLELRASFRFGGSGVHDLRVQVHREEIARDAALLRADPAREGHAYPAEVRRGRSHQVVPIPVARDVLLGIADAIAGAEDADDAGHRFWHWENPDARRPCDQCRETLDAVDARADAALRELLACWAQKLDAEEVTIVQLLAEYDALPRRARRRR